MRQACRVDRVGQDSLEGPDSPEPRETQGFPALDFLVDRERRENPDSQVSQDNRERKEHREVLVSQGYRAAPAPRVTLASQDSKVLLELLVQRVWTVFPVAPAFPVDPVDLARPDVQDPLVSLVTRVRPDVMESLDQLVSKETQVCLAMEALELLVSLASLALRVTQAYPVFPVALVSQVKRERAASPDSLVLQVPSGPLAPQVWPSKGPKVTLAPLELQEEQVFPVRRVSEAPAVAEGSRVKREFPVLPVSPVSPVPKESTDPADSRVNPVFPVQVD